MKIKRLLLVTFAACFSAMSFVRAQAASTPNVIIIMADDQGYQDLGCFGSPKIKTPHIDRMAKEGMRFTDFYSGASVCTPSRAALLTGCYAKRVGGLGVLFPRDKRGLNPDEITIADLLKTKGYATACIGKWHLGHLKEFLPTSQGFDTYYGVPYSNDMTIDVSQPLANDVVLREGVTLENIRNRVKKNLVPLMRDTEIIEYPVDQNTLTKRYTEEAISFIKKNKEKPFFIYLPHTMPHIPLYATPQFEGKSEIGLYGDTIEELDWSTGQILETLRKLKLDKNTLVIYTSDNGPWKLAANSWVKGNMNRRVGGFAHPLRGYKFSRFEGGMRVPTVMWWPGRIPAGKECSEVGASMDFLPTCAAIAGAKVPGDRVVDGVDLSPALFGKGKVKRDTYFYYRGQKLYAVRKGPWKAHYLTRDAYGRSKEEQHDPPILYHLDHDPSEKIDVAADHPNVLTEIAKAVSNHKAKLKPGKPQLEALIKNVCQR